MGIDHHVRVIPTKCNSSTHINFVTTFCSCKVSLLPTKWFTEVFMKAIDVEDSLEFDHLMEGVL